MIERTPLSHEVVCIEIKFVENYFFLEHYVTSEVAVSHSVLYYNTPYKYSARSLV